MGQRGLIRRLVDEATRRTPAHNPTLVRHGVLGRDFADQRIAAAFGPPPAVHFAVELAGRSDADLLHGPQRRSPGHVITTTRRPVGSRR